MANRLFQSVIHQMRSTIDRTIGVIDSNFNIIACSDLGKIGEVLDTEESIANLGDACVVVNGYTIKALGNNDQFDYFTFVQGDDPLAEKYCSILAISFTNIKFYYDEKYDRNSFVKNIIVDNILPGDVIFRTRELHITIDVKRVVYLIRISKHIENSAVEILQGLFPGKKKDFVMRIDDHDMVVIKELKLLKKTL